MPASRVGFIGLGIMGSRMAANLARAGFEMTVWNRTAQTAQDWVVEHGGHLAPTPAALAAGVDLVITMVVDGPQVREVLLGADGVAEGAASGLLCVDCTTIGQAAALEIGERLGERGLRLLDAPVTGSLPGARDGTLLIMVGGEAADLEEARPVFEAMGKTILHVGALGAGQAIKVISNSVAVANAATVAEGLLAGKAAGVDLDALVAVMEGGAASSRMLTLKQEPMRTHDFTPLFRLAHMIKDVELCLAASTVPFESARRALEDMRAAERLGHGDEDFAALALAVEQRTGLALG
ncbi:MAG TPA: NAD(P)-dependent oxidoreductase [Solirubrobacteraceae bacterium]|nr:NAD(P)-dependent oxidoreductase [Solirubrobacteraceae bacterium]